MSEETELDGVAGGLYAALVNSELERQRDREATVRQRGSMVVSTAGVLITLILALGSVNRTPAKAVVNSQMGKALLEAGLGFFVLAAVLGMVVNLPWRKLGSPHEGYSDWVATLADGDRWSRSDLIEVACEVAAVKIGAIKKLRAKNHQRNWVLASAIISVLVATACLAVSVAASLR